MTLRQALRYAARVVRQKRQAGERRVRAARRPTAESVTEPGEAYRQAAGRHALRTCVPAAPGLLVDRLVGLLGGSGPASCQATAALAQLGPPALPALIWRFTHTRGPSLQSGIVEVLGRIAGGLGPDQRFDLLTESLILSRFAASDAVRRGLAGVVAL